MNDKRLTSTVCLLQLVARVKVLRASPVQPGGGVLRGNHPCVRGLSVPPPIRLHRVSPRTSARVFPAEASDVCNGCSSWFSLIPTGLYATPLCRRQSPSPSRPVSGPTRRTTATSLDSGTVRPPPPTSISTPSSLSTST